jgi:hypothetical protein
MLGGTIGAEITPGPIGVSADGEVIAGAVVMTGSCDGGGGVFEFALAGSTIGISGIDGIAGSSIPEAEVGCIGIPWMAGVVGSVGPSSFSTGKNAGPGGGFMDCGVPWSPTFPGFHTPVSLSFFGTGG